MSADIGGVLTGHGQVDHTVARCNNTPNPPDAGRLEAGFLARLSLANAIMTQWASEVLTDC